MIILFQITLNKPFSTKFCLFLIFNAFNTNKSSMAVTNWLTADYTRFLCFFIKFLGHFLQRRFRFSLFCCCDGSSFVSILTNASMHIIMCFCRYFFSARKRLSICPLQSCSDKAERKCRRFWCPLYISGIFAIKHTAEL